MKSKKWQLGLIIIGVIIVIGAIIGYVMWNKPHDKVEDTKGIVLTVNEIASAFSNDEQAANKEYLDKAIQITGTVAEIEENQDGNLLVILKGEAADMDVQCSMRDKEQKTDIGEKITIKGFCSGASLFGVSLRDGIIIK